MIVLEIHFPCVRIDRNSLHLLLTASLTSKYQFKIKGCVGVHASVSPHLLFFVCTYWHVYSFIKTKCKLYFKRLISYECTQWYT